MPAPSPTTVPGVSDVVVTVTTRLHPWALGQVAGKVLARRPALGEAISCLGRFSDVREFLIAVQPAAQDDLPQPSPPCKTRLLKGLFLDYSAQEEQYAKAA